MRRQVVETLVEHTARHQHAARQMDQIRPSEPPPARDERHGTREAIEIHREYEIRPSEPPLPGGPAVGWLAGPAG